jgi:hypothetical protein
MDILINDLTRMGSDWVCIAGVNYDFATIRPEFAHSGIDEMHLFRDSKPIIYPRAVVEMQVKPKRACTPPHLEDHLWTDTEKTKLLRVTKDERWRNALRNTAFPSVEKIFETKLLHDNKNIAPATGVRSLGTIKPKSIELFLFKTLERNGIEYPDWRLFFTDGEGNVFEHVKINDLSLQCFTLGLTKEKSAKQINAKLNSMLKSSEVWLRIGVTRPYEGWCWLQVTGIYTFPDYLKGKCFADFQ